MNSYTLIAKLRRARRSHVITAGAQALYYELIAINNEEEWVETFKCTANELCGAIGVSEKTIAGYRVELIEAGLLDYISGKTKRCPSTYCLHGSSFGSRLGGNFGSKIYHQPVSKTPDLNKTKTETKTNIEEEDVDIARSRQNEFNEEVDNFFSEKIEEGSPSLQTETLKNKKSLGAREKVFPTLNEAMDKVKETANWRNVLQHHEVTEEGREQLFKIFYEQKEDAYRIRYPPVTEMASHFYFWIGSRKKLESLKPKFGLSDGNTTTKNTATSTRKRSEDARAELTDLKDRSEEFLRRSSSDQY